MYVYYLLDVAQCIVCTAVRYQKSDVAKSDLAQDLL